MAYRSRRSLVFLIFTQIFALTTLGCGDDTPLRPPTGSDGGLDVAARDTGGDTPRVDVGPPIDGGTAGSCTGTGEFEILASATAVSVGLAANRDSFLIAWSSQGPEGRVLRSRLLPSEGEPSESLAITSDFSTAKDPAITATDEGWLVLFSSNVEDNFEIYTRRLAADGTVSEELPLRLTTNGFLDERTGIANTAGGIFAAWNQQDLDSGGAPMIVQTALNSSGAMMGERQVIGADDGGFGRISMGRFAGGSAIAWAIEGGGFGFQRFLSTGATRGDVLRLTEARVLSFGYGRLDGEIGMGGIAVYEALVSDIRPEVRWRSVLDDGTLSDNERELMREIPTRSPAVASLGEGHVVSLIGNGEEGSSLYLLTIDDVGNVVASGAIRPVDDFNRARTWAAGTGRGEVLVLLEERMDDGTRLTALRFECTESL